MNAVVIYGSCYGSAQAYAEHIAAALSCPALSAESASRGDVEGRALVLFGGSFYAGSVAGAKRAGRLEKYFGQAKLLCFTCGLADPAKAKTQDEARALLNKAFPLHAGMPVFCLRGNMDYARLSAGHRAMMAMLVAFLKRKKERSEEDEQLLATYGQKIEFLDLSTAQPVIAAAKASAEE